MTSAIWILIVIVAMTAFRVFASYRSCPFRERPRLSTRSAPLRLSLASEPLDYVHLGWESAERGDFDQAMQNFALAIFFDPQDAYAYFARATVYASDLGEYELAIADFTRSLELAPNHVLTLSNRAMAYLDRGDHELALADWSRAIEIDPRPFFHLQRSKVYAVLGERELADADYRASSAAA